MTIELNILSNNPSFEFDIVNFYINIKYDTAIISLKNRTEKDDIKCINVALTDLKKLAKIINDINL